MAKQKTMNWVIVIAALVVVGTVIGSTTGLFAVTGDQPGDGDEVQPDWTDRNVNLELDVKDVYNSGATVNATVKLYDEQPADWENPVADFDDAENYEAYTGISSDWDLITLNEKPGVYYAVIEASGYNTKFVEVQVPNYDDIGEPLTDYNSDPETEDVKMTQVGSAAAAPSDIDLALVNDTNVDVKEYVTITVAENTRFLPNSVSVEDKLGFSTDSDGDGVYDEGISEFSFDFMETTYEVFEPNNNVDEFDNEDRFEADISGTSAISDKDAITMTFEFTAEETGDYSGSNDEVLGEGDGSIVTTTIWNYGAEGDNNQFAQFDIVA